MELNLGQEIFLVLFSILYGVMLQSLAGTQSFPLGKVVHGFKTRNNDDDFVLESPDFYECRKVFRERNHITIWKFDEVQKADYKKWLLRMWRKRLIWSFILLNVLPIIYFWFILSLLGTNYWRSVTLNGNFIEPVIQVFKIGTIFWSALGAFGFYRFHHALIAGKWKSLFCDVIKKIEKRGFSFDCWANVFWGFLYLLPPIHLLILIPSLL